MTPLGGGVLTMAPEEFVREYHKTGTSVFTSDHVKHVTMIL